MESNYIPVVQPTDDLFWFNHPGLLLYLIHFVLFQNAFQLVFFAWSWYEFGYPSCFHKHIEDIIIRISMGVPIFDLSMSSVGRDRINSNYSRHVTNDCLQGMSSPKNLQQIRVSSQQLNHEIWQAP